MSYSVKIRAGERNYSAGPGHNTLVMALIGASHRRQFSEQAKKISALAAAPEPPDIISDLSIVRYINAPPLWRRVLDESTAAAACLPVYTARLERDGRIAKTSLLDVALEQMEAGVGLLTIHPTPCERINTLSERRVVPCTSRGGGLIIRDALSRGWTNENLYLQLLPELVSHARRHGTVLSLGACYRAANIFDSFDAAQVAEIEFQIQLANEIRRHGVGVVIESPGHARPRDIRNIAALLRQGGYPIMPLGPIPVDTAVGQDHISSAIGATLLGLEGCAHILAAVTREEHTGGIPTIESTLEAVASARVAARVIDLDQLGDDTRDKEIVEARAGFRTCVATKRSHGCDRCARACPL